MFHIISHFNHLGEAFSRIFRICRGARFMMTKSYEAVRDSLFVMEQNGSGERNLIFVSSFY